jgi:autotransporter-associated beta strand protein
MKTNTYSISEESETCGRTVSYSSRRAIQHEPHSKAKGLMPVLLGLTAMVLGGSPTLHAADITWGNTATDYNAGASWTGGTAPSTGDAAVFSSAVTNQPALSANITNQQIRFTTSTGGWTLNGTSALTLTSTGTGTTAGTGSAIVGTNTSGTNTINAAIKLGGAAATTATFNQAASGTLAITGNISSTNAITGISLVGASGSVFTLSGNNTYSGTTTLSSASIKLNINSATAIGAGALVLAQDATIDNTSGAAITLANNNNISLGSRNLIFTGTGDLSFGSGTATLGSSRSITVSAGNLTIGSMNADFTTLVLTKAGSGTLILANAAGANFQGGTTLSAGTLSLGNKSALGTGALTISAASTALSATANLGGANAVANAINLRNNSSIVGNNNLTLSGALTQNGSNLSLTVNNAGATEFSGPIYLSEASGTGRTLTLVATTNATVSGAISNFNGSGTAGVLRKNNAGTLVLSSSSSSYTGRTETMSGGVLSVAKLANGGSNSSIGASSNAAGNLVFANGTTLLYTGSGDSTDRLFTIDGNGAGLGVAIDASGTGALNFTNTGSITHSTSGQTRTLTLQGNSTADNTFALLLANNGGGALSVAKSGTGTWVLTGNSTFTGATAINAGALTVGHANALGTTAGGVTVSSGAALQLTGGIAVGAEALNISGDGIGSGGALRNLSGTNSYAGAITLGAAARINSDSGTLLTLSGGISGTQNLTIGGAGNTTVSGTIATSTGTLTKDGLGTLTLNAANSYSGATAINAGALTAGHANALGTTAGGVTVSSGAALQLTGGIAVGAEALNISGDGIASGGALRNLSGTNSYAGAITLGAAARINSDAGTLLTLSGGISGTQNLTIGGAGNTTVSGTIATSTGTLTKDGLGTLTLNATNSYSGTTTINSGTLTLASNGNLGTSAITLTGGTLDLGGKNLSNTISGLSGGTLSNGTITNNGGNYAFQNGAVSAILAGTNGLTKTGSGLLTLTASNAFNGSTTISAGNLSISSTAALSSTSGIGLGDTAALIYTGTAASFDRNISVTSGNGTIRNDGSGLLTLAGTLTKNGTTLTLAGGSGGITVSGVISGSANNSDLIIDGGTTTLANANTYNGPTFIINGATLNANAAGALPTSTLTAVTINGSSTLALGANQQIASLTGAASSIVALGSNTITIGNISGNTTYAGSITGASSSALVKDGASTQVLTGINTGFTGTTTINSGTLQAASAGALGGTSNIDINGGTLLVTADDAIHGKNIELGGSGVGLQFSGNYSGAIGNLTLSANSIIDLGAGSVQILFQGLTSSNHTLSFYNWSGTTLWNGGNGTTDTDKVYFGPDLSDEALAKIYFYTGPGDSFLGSGFDLGLKATGFDPAMGHQIIPVPEPETYATGLLLLLGGAWWMWKQKRKSEACSHGTLLPCGGKGGHADGNHRMRFDSNDSRSVKRLVEQLVDVSGPLFSRMSSLMLC